MTVPFTIILAGLLLQVCTETPQSLIPPVALTECCADLLDESGLCPQNSFCHSGCYRHWFKNGSTTCIRCINGTFTDSSNNQTECINRGPGIAASLCLGTLFISSFFILSVAAFFYLKRSNKLPHLFYQRNKASILQPNEMAEMMRSPISAKAKIFKKRKTFCFYGFFCICCHKQCLILHHRLCMFKKWYHFDFAPYRFSMLKDTIVLRYCQSWPLPRSLVILIHTTGNANCCKPNTWHLMGSTSSISPRSGHFIGLFCRVRNFISEVK
ncbi:uncharacterized protein C1orf159 homolog isoform X2 [Heterodontus francisci]|uniref:uncharacterized protein C1orf159 homolog isoform X2 n=1 Tax=Heterodontus francisci TaxID=7792 RepID=UPI00355B4D71